MDRLVSFSLQELDLCCKECYLILLSECRWMDGSFLDLNGESIELEVEEYIREIYKMQKFFQQKHKKAEQEKEKIAGLKRKPKEEEDKQESATILICTSVVEQVKEFKVVFSSYRRVGSSKNEQLAIVMELHEAREIITSSLFLGGLSL